MSLSRRQTLLTFFSSVIAASCSCRRAVAWMQDESRKPVDQQPAPSQTKRLGAESNIPEGPGCTFRVGERRSQGFKIVHSSGDVRLDGCFDLEQNTAPMLFRVDPDFGYFDDPSPNAFASPNHLIGLSKFGSVLFGINLIRLTYAFLGDTALIGILAHEYAHILQFSTGFPRFAGKIPELHADFVAGWYLGRKQVAGTLNINMIQFAGSLWSLGDFAYNNPGHHGEPSERVWWMNSGWGLAFQNPLINASGVAQVGARMLGL